MKILFCSHEKFHPLVIGGSVGNVKIVEKMVERGHEVTVATPLYCDKKALEKKFGVTIAPFSPFYIDRYVPCRERKYMLYALLYVFHLFRLLACRKYDAVFVRNCVLGGSCCVVKPFFRMPFFLSMTDFLSGFSFTNPRVPKPLVRALFSVEKWIGYQFDRTFVITARMKDALSINDPQRLHNVRVSYDGVDTGRFDARAVTPEAIERTRRETGFDSNVVVYHGTVQTDSVELFAAIINDVAARYPAVKVNFVLIGMGEGYTRLRAALGERGNVRFMGFVPHDDLPRFIAASSVGIVPYKRTFNSDVILTLKILEFLAMGVPVVTTGLLSVQDIFGKFEEVTIADGPHCFSEAIVQSLARPRRTEAMEFVRNNFSWDRVTTTMVEEIESYCRRNENK